MFFVKKGRHLTLIHEWLAQRNIFMVNYNGNYNVEKIFLDCQVASEACEETLSNESLLSQLAEANI